MTPLLRSPFDGLTFFGAIVRRVVLDEPRSRLWIQTDAGWHSYDADGDCCSHSWWYRLRGVTNLIGQTVLGVFEPDLEDVDVDDGLGYQDVDEKYGYALRTLKGDFEVCFRNSSNGYYGGYLTAGFYPAGEAEPSVEGEEITSDWLTERAPMGCSKPE